MADFIISGIMGTNLSDRVAGTGSSFDQGNQFALGTRVLTKLGGTYLYVHAAEAVAINLWVSIDQNYEVLKLTATELNKGFRVGVADQAAFADNDFGWVCVDGFPSGAVLTLCAKQVRLYTSGTAGVLDDASTVGTLVPGIVAATDNTTVGTLAVTTIMKTPSQNAA